MLQLSEGAFALQVADALPPVNALKSESVYCEIALPLAFGAVQVTFTVPEVVV